MNLKRFAMPLCLAALLGGCAGDRGNIDLDKRLTRGVNLQLAEQPAQQSRASGAFKMPAKSDLRIIRDMGLRHTRIRVDPIELMAGGALNNSRAAELRDVIERINDWDLTVILTTQPDSRFKGSMEPTRSATASFANFWRALAAYLSDIPTGELVFEPLNEPEHESASEWQQVQELLVGAIRAGAPQHRVIVAGHRFSSIPELVAMQPLPFSNLLYSFHFYDPHNFTHQGANWGWPMWQQFHDWPYPSSPNAVAPVLASQAPEAREHLLHYGRQQWNKDRLASELGRAIAWAESHNVNLICTEFGAYRDGIEPRYRKAWLSDVRSLLASAGIGWTLWDYSGNFGLVSGEVGDREVDTVAIKALGLEEP